MIVLDLISEDGVLAGAANVDEGFAASSFGFMQAVAQAKGFSVAQGYADTDHPSMNVYSGDDWTSFVRTAGYSSSDSTTLLARASAGQSSSGGGCSSSLYWLVGRTSSGLPICVYWPGLTAPAALLALVGGGLLGSWWLGLGAAALVFYLVPKLVHSASGAAT